MKVETSRLRRELFDLRIQTVTQKVEDVSRIGKIRRDVARLLTETSARRIAAAPAPAGAAVAVAATPAKGAAQSSSKNPRTKKKA
jgi:large subunit ribosomal protein L29